MREKSARSAGASAPRKATKTATLRVRVTPEMATWLRRSARCAGVDVSDVVRGHLRVAFDKRHTL